MPRCTPTIPLFDIIITNNNNNNNNKNITIIIFKHQPNRDSEKEEIGGLA
jgi:hypothetical protein